MSISLSEYYSDDQLKKAKVEKVESRYKVSFYNKRKLITSQIVDVEDTALVIAEDWVRDDVRES
jgi:hypothetical protein